MLRRLLPLAFLCLAACDDDGPDDVVGAACFDDRDCYDQCETGSEFPDGFCTLSCRDDRDCTADSICVADRGGICMFPCEVHAHCDFLGPGYYCRERDDTFGVTVTVCMGD